MSSVVETSLLIYFIFIKITHSSSSKKARPALRGLRERYTELWDVYDLRFRYLVIYVDNLDFYIHMSSHTVDLSSLRSVDGSLRAQIYFATQSLD